MIKDKTNNTAFNDGVLTILRKNETSDNGDMPAVTYSDLWSLPYNRMTVGVTRYYTAKQAGENVKTVVRTLYRPVETSDRVLIFGNTGVDTLQILQVQVVQDSSPQMMDLTLGAFD